MIRCRSESCQQRGCRARLSGKVLVVTGAGRGLGRACARRFAQEGADLVLLDVAREIEGVPYELATESQLEHTAELCRREGAAVLCSRADVRDLGALEVQMKLAVERFGRLDGLLNNAGIAAPAGRPVHEIEESEWLVMLDVDLSGAWRMTKVVGAHMAARRSGSIVNVASTAGLVGFSHLSGYVAAKHGLVGLTRATALDYAPLGIRVNALCPGSIRDEAELEGRLIGEIARALDLPEGGGEGLFSRVQPMQRLGDSDDVSYAAVWLASDESRNVTGSVLTVDGGFTAR